MRDKLTKTIPIFDNLSVGTEKDLESVLDVFGDYRVMSMDKCNGSF